MAESNFSEELPEQSSRRIELEITVAGKRRNRVDIAVLIFDYLSNDKKAKKLADDFEISLRLEPEDVSQTSPAQRMVKPIFGMLVPQFGIGRGSHSSGQRHYLYDSEIKLLFDKIEAALNARKSEDDSFTITVTKAEFNRATTMGASEPPQGNQSRGNTL